jgi:hypothetical protein
MVFPQPQSRAMSNRILEISLPCEPVPSLRLTQGVDHDATVL